jgi:hypothetical protein
MGNRMGLFLRLVNSYLLLLWQHGMGILGCWRYLFPNRNTPRVLPLVSLEYIMEARLPLAGEKAIRYRPAIVSFQ